MSEEAWGAQESLLSQTDADVLGKPLAQLSKVIMSGFCIAEECQFWII